MSFLELACRVLSVWGAQHDSWGCRLHTNLQVTKTSCTHTYECTMPCGSDQVNAGNHFCLGRLGWYRLIGSARGLHSSRRYVGEMGNGFLSVAAAVCCCASCRVWAMGWVRTAQASALAQLGQGHASCYLWALHRMCWWGPVCACGQLAPFTLWRHVCPASCVSQLALLQGLLCVYVVAPASMGWVWHYHIHP